MSGVKRYALEQSYDSPGTWDMEEREDGSYVRSLDYLASELGRHEAQLECSRLYEQREALAARVGEMERERDAERGRAELNLIRCMRCWDAGTHAPHDQDFQNALDSSGAEWNAESACPKGGNVSVADTGEYEWACGCEPVPCECDKGQVLALKATLAQHREALGPFAKVAENYSVETAPDRMVLLAAPGETGMANVTLGDCRRARSVWEAGRG